MLYALHDIEEFIKRGSSRGSRLLASPAVNRREKDIVSLARKKGVTVREISDEAFASEARNAFGSEMPKGLRHLLLSPPEGTESSRSTVNDLWDGIEKAGDNSLVLILDGITDPHNLGAILRSADLMEVDAVILPRRRSAEVNDTVRRVSSGASHYVPVYPVANLVRVLEQLKEKGYWVYAADLDGQKPSDVKLGGKTVLILGSEGSGPGKEIVKHADGIVTIPTGGHIDSFNVSVAAGILLYEIRRQTGFEWK